MKLRLQVDETSAMVRHVSVIAAGLIYASIAPDA
jgi:hypothetical protein